MRALEDERDALAAMPDASLSEAGATNACLALGCRPRAGLAQSRRDAGDPQADHPHLIEEIVVCVADETLDLVFTGTAAITPRSR